jgi:O-acetyl-ADP-ribose deacetylase (regulator of RNase III)
MSYVHGFQIDATHSLHIFRGSLTEVEAEALVSSDDNYLSAGGGVSAALALAAGRQVERERHELVQQRHPRLGDVVRTSAGALPCNHLYHAITIDFDRGKRMDEASLCLLVANLLDRATADGVRSLGIPALGTGAAFFDLGRAAEIIIGELLERVVKTDVSRVVLALLGDHAERLFYEELVRSRADRCAVRALRHRESMLSKKTDGSRTLEDRIATEETAAVGEMIEQFPNLVDEASLAAAPTESPRLVAGLAEMILKYAAAKDVEQELLTLPACRDFRGPLQARLMEFLYLSEGNLRIALGPVLFRSRDLRNMATELGVDVAMHRDHEQLIAGILRALCFNPVVPPVGITSYLARLEELCAGVRREPEPAMQIVMHAAIEAGQILERVLADLLRLYGSFFWGTTSLAEMIQRNIVPARRDADPLSRLTIG